VLAIVVLLSACAGPAPTPTPTATPDPTDTPRPTPTPTLTPTRTPTPTATPEPLAVGVLPGAPAQIETAVDALVAAHPLDYRRADDPARAALLVAPGAVDGAERTQALAERVFVPVVPFPTLVDDVALADIRAYWSGDATALRGLADGVRAPKLYVVTATLEALTELWGSPAPGTPIVVVAPDQLVAAAWDARPLAWSIVPFDALEPRWKALRLDGQNVFDKQLDVAQYPLVQRWIASGPQAAVEALAGQVGGPVTNRDVARMTIVAMTGVTAPSRHTMSAIEARGDVLFPAASVSATLRAADVTHVSNEVSFFDGCPPGDGQGGALCGKANYIELLKVVGADVIELTGNHLTDYGRTPLSQTLQMYRDAGMVTYGGGITITAALSPTVVTANGNRIAFLGCNTVGPDTDFATATEPGSAPCDYEMIFRQMAALKAQHQADVIIFTFQFLETQDGDYHYESTYPQRQDFHLMAESGADIVSGSQAHQPQGFSFTPGGHFISYGLGNLFFDQMFSLGTRQGLIEEHVIYNGRHIATELITTLLYDSAQPRITTGDDRGSLLNTLFGVSDWP
jgi:hypothetical protein